MTAFFIGVAIFCFVPVSFVLWKVLGLMGRSRTGARLAFRTTLVTGLAALLASLVYINALAADAASGSHWSDLIIEDNLYVAIAAYYGVVATFVALIFPLTNPNRGAFLTRCPQCKNRRHLHTQLCYRCGARLAPSTTPGFR